MGERTVPSRHATTQAATLTRWTSPSSASVATKTSVVEVQTYIIASDLPPIGGVKRVILTDHGLFACTACAPLITQTALRTIEAAGRRRLAELLREAIATKVVLDEPQ